MDIEGLKQEGKNQLLDKYIEEYNNMGYMDYINNNLVYSGLLSYNMMKDFMGGRFMEDPCAAPWWYFLARMRSQNGRKALRLLGKQPSQ